MGGTGGFKDVSRRCEDRVVSRASHGQFLLVLWSALRGYKLCTRFQEEHGRHLCQEVNKGGAPCSNKRVPSSTTGLVLLDTVSIHFTRRAASNVCLHVTRIPRATVSHPGIT